MANNTLQQLMQFSQPNTYGITTGIASAPYMDPAYGSFNNPVWKNLQSNIPGLTGNVNLPYDLTNPSQVDWGDASNLTKDQMVNLELDLMNSSNGMRKGFGDMDFGDQAKTVLGGLKGLGDLYLGFQGLKLGRKSLAEQIRSFNASYDAQRQLLNAGIYDRNVRRNRELGLDLDQSRQAAQQYVDARGIRELSVAGQSDKKRVG